MQNNRAQILSRQQSRIDAGQKIRVACCRACRTVFRLTPRRCPECGGALTPALVTWPTSPLPSPRRRPSPFPQDLGAPATSATLLRTSAPLPTVNDGANVAFTTLQRREDSRVRVRTGLVALDEPLGGGLCGVVLLSGRRGAGKTSLSAALLESMRERALLVGLEESLENVERRLTRLGGLGARFTREPDFARVLAAVDALADPPGLVVLDSLHKALGNPAQTMVLAREWSDRRDIPILAIARENKAGEVSGSAAIESEADAVLIIVKNPDNSRSLHVTKNRFSEKEGIYPLVLDSSGFSDSTGDEK